jgi:hypothetical protein
MGKGKPQNPSHNGPICYKPKEDENYYQKVDSIWKERRSRSILDTEEHLKYLYQNWNNGPLTETNLEELKNLENCVTYG